MRGKLRKVNIVHAASGITPAGAGKTRRRTIANTCPEDHPRRCGENLFFGRGSRTPAGSPPQVRGKLLGFHFCEHSVRITPAGAGKTARTSTTAGFTRDHPRRCGENSSDNVKCSFDLGSPPQVRGKQYRAASTSVRVGITPAGAGKTKTA